MSDFTPEWRLLVNGVNYSDVAISEINHQAGRDDIYQQPNPSYIELTLIASEADNYNLQINDGVSLQLKDSTATYRTIFGGNITDITTAVSVTGSIGTVFSYSVIAMGSLAKLAKIVTDGVLARDTDGDQIYELLYDVFLNEWNQVSPLQTWATYDATTTWSNAENIGLGEIDRPGVYEMENRASNEDTTYNIASAIASSAFGVLYEDSNGNISYADTQHRQNYLANNGFTEISANTAIGSGLGTVTRSGDIRNLVVINYGNNFGSAKTAEDLQSIELFGFKAETINSFIHDATDAQDVADRYIALRAFPRAFFEQITFPITNPELDDTDRDALLGIFVGQPIKITDLPVQIAQNEEFQGYVEGWSWSTAFNQLFLTINLSPIEFSQVAVKWEDVSASEYWNTLSAILTWENAIGAVA
jgi:hypothetical protein